MSRSAIVVAAALAFAVTLPAAPAHALRARVFVSKTGADVGACSFSAPCQSLDYALSGVEPNGEITILDSGGYNPITITQGVTITVPPGVEAGIAAAAGTDAITINGGLNDIVSLRGLTLDGAAAGRNGITFNSGASLTIKDSFIRNFTGTGIYFVPSTASSLFVSNTLVANNSTDGISVFPTSAGVSVVAVLNHVEVNNNTRNGIDMNASRSMENFITATASESVAAGNTGIGFSADTAGGYVGFTLFHCVASSNGTGMKANGTNAHLVVAQTMTDWSTSADWQLAGGGTLFSYGDNYASVPGSGSVIPYSKF